MANPITLTETENRLLQSIFREIYEDYRLRSVEPDMLLSLVQAFETYPAPLVLTAAQTNRVTWQLQKFVEISRPYPYPYYPTTFGQDTRQLRVIESIIVKLGATSP